MTSTRTFTLDEYRALLELALSAGWRSVDFESSERPAVGPDPELLVRHDVDYAPKHMPPMAAIEAELGVRTTYCVHVDSPWYRIDSRENRAAVMATLDAGHWLGLHFDASATESDREVLDGVAEQARRLGELFSREVRVVSFHMPGRRPVRHLVLPGDLINTYASRFFEEIGYVSDSNENWHGADIAAELANPKHRRLQMLIHPFWWREREATMRAKLEALAEEIGVDVHEIVTPEQWRVIEEREAA